MLQYFINTKTPIWTGGIKGVSDTIHETGIIGSLRWWYEVILRGLGVFACDPTEDSGTFSRCPFGPKGHEKQCNACDLFGMTGHQRQFKIYITRGSQVYDQTNAKELINIRPQSPARTTGWFLGAGRVAKDSPLVLQCTPFAKPLETDNALNVLLALLSRWAGIGARQQHGYGVFDITNAAKQNIVISAYDLNSFLTKAKNVNQAETRIGAPGTQLPVFHNFFFAKIKLDNLPANWGNNIDGTPLDSARDNETRDNEMDIEKQRGRFNTWHSKHSSHIFAPALKNQLRFVVFNGNAAIQEYLFGKVSKTTKSAARVNVSHVYSEKNHREVRIWGDVSDSTIKQQIYDALNGASYPPITPLNIWQAATGQSGITAQMTEWREMGEIARCKRAGATCANLCANSESFLRCLLS